MIVIALCYLESNAKLLIIITLCYLESNKDKVKLDHSERPQEPKVTHNFKSGSKVKHRCRYGVIKWIGILSDLSEELYAGLEMVTV